MKRSNADRAVFYTRDSGGKHETTPGEYVRWAQGRAREMGLTFRGTPAQIEDMIRVGTSASGDLFLDYEVSGYVMDRPGLNALIEEVSRDQKLKHVLIPKRDRLARPNHPMEGMRLENLLQTQGVTLVFQDLTAPALGVGKRADFAELIRALSDYDQAGKFRRDLAQKMIHSQIALAREGFWTGGRAPFGFRRWLCRVDGTLIRELQDGEHVRMAGHHVVLQPGPEHEIQLIRRILEMLQNMPASRVAAALTTEGIPSPDAGRTRRDGGRKHRVSGVWSQSTIINIARNPLLQAITQHGLRSMGDQLRFTPTGPREVIESDFRPDKKPKVIRNPENQRVKAPARFEPLVGESHQQLIQILDQRAGSQRGKPRSRHPDQNPLGGRVFDMGCTWPMYREPYSGAFRYVCGLYSQSNGAKCHHNNVGGLPALEFALSTIRQRLLSPKLLSKLKTRLIELTAIAGNDSGATQILSQKSNQLTRLRSDLENITRNMALAKTASQLEAMQTVFDETQAAVLRLDREIKELSVAARPRSSASDVDAALELAARLPDLAKDTTNLRSGGEAIRLVNLKMFLRFDQVQSGKRLLNKIAGGVVTLGSAEPPIEVYQGRTDRKSIKAAGSAPTTDTEPADEARSNDPREESLGNVNRGGGI